MITIRPNLYYRSLELVHQAFAWMDFNIVGRTSQNLPAPDRESNPEPSEYVTEILTLLNKFNAVRERVLLHVKQVAQSVMILCFASDCTSIWRKPYIGFFIPVCSIVPHTNYQTTSAT
jgi:hypothetical protein